MSARARVFVGLGSNLDDPAQQVARALQQLDALADTRVLRASRLYRTPPWGDLEQPEFVNAVAELDTALAPAALLAGLQQLEAGAGRSRSQERALRRWGPRVLDLDLLLFGQQVIAHGSLQVPHPRLAERAFVLVPLAELDPQLHVPGLGRVQALLAAVDAAGIEALG